MSAEWDEERRAILQELQVFGSAGRAEGAPDDQIAAGYYPVADHLRLLDPGVVLVVGPRGSGKTEVARVLTDATLYNAIKQYAPAVRLPSDNSEWLRAYPSSQDVFEPIGLRQFEKVHQNATDPWREVWFAYLVRILKEHFSAAEQSSLGSIFAPRGAEIDVIYDAFQRLGTKPVVALDLLDQRLESENKYLFVTYDELDKLGEGDWKLVEYGVRGLVALWAAYSRRWRRIRAKLFLRTDLYERHAKIGGADLAKLAAGRVELVWSDRDLYGCLLKGMANSGNKLASYVREIKSVVWIKDNALGQIPKLRSWQDARPVVERMIGVYMGANQKKGLVYRWLLDHVRDGLGRGYPRPFVQLIEVASSQELQHFSALRPRRVLEPASLRRALDRVSSDHVAQCRDEWPWLETVKDRLKSDPLVPYLERQAIRLLEEIPSTKSVLPPFGGRELLDYLLELGVFRRRPDGRIDVPDLFLAGLGLKRKGGVRKGK